VYCLNATGDGAGSTEMLWSYSPVSTSPDPSLERLLAPIIGPGRVWVTAIDYIGWESVEGGAAKIYTFGVSVYGFGLQNHAPATPGAPSGPSEGLVGQELTFTASTTDPDAGDLLWYSFSWGDGSSKDWIGPYESGVTVTQKHTWSNGGSFAVKVEAKDFFTVTPSSVQLPVKIYQTTLEIGSITGGTSVSSEVKNTGTLTGSNINWTITVKGGFLGLINVEKTGGPISAIAAGGSSGPIKTGLILGLGPVTITVNASGENIKEVSKTATGFTFFIFTSVK
jgi:hypothetical protein